MGTDVRLGITESPLAATLLTVGQETFPRELATGSTTMSTGLLRLSYFAARKGEVVNSIAVSTAATGAGATPTLIRFGIYSVASNGDITLVASTASDTALLPTPNTEYSKTLSSPYAVEKGVRYAIGILVVTAATAPNLAGNVPNGSIATSARSPRIAGAITGQADLPASALSGSIGNTTTRPFAILIP